MNYFDIDTTKTTPLYLQIASSIKSAIDHGVLRYSDILPTEKDLCNAFSCSRIVAKMAYDVLASEQYVDRIRGKGTFVSNRPRWIVNVDRILQIDTLGKHQHHPITRKTVFQSISHDFTRVASILGLPTHEKLVHYQRVFHIGIHPILLQSCYVPSSLLLPLAPLLTDDESFFGWVELATSHIISSVQNRVGVIALEAFESYMCQVPLGSSAHICRATILDAANNKVAYVEMRLPNSAFQLEISQDE